MAHDQLSRRRWLESVSIIGLSLLAPSGVRTAVAQSSPQSYLDALRAGGCVVLVRHALTTPGIGDPPGMRLDDCSSQRDLSAEGRAQSRRLGQWFRVHGLRPQAVRSSQWCRCLHTAREAFHQRQEGPQVPITPWVALNSFFQGHGSRDQQLKDALSAARIIHERRKTGEFEVWVSHQVVISALTGHACAMGEMIVAQSQGPDQTLRVLASGLVF